MIESERLILRPFQETDAEGAFQWLGDKEVMKYILYGHDKSFKDTEVRIISYINHYHQFGYSKYVVIEKDSNKLIGDCGIMTLHGLGLNELGYRILKDYWGKGIASEAALAVIKYAYKQLGFKEIHAVVEDYNLASVHMLRNKLGFQYQKKVYCFGEEVDLYHLPLTYKY